MNKTANVRIRQAESYWLSSGLGTTLLPTPIQIVWEPCLPNALWQASRLCRQPGHGCRPGPPNLDGEVHPSTAPKERFQGDLGERLAPPF